MDISKIKADLRKGDMKLIAHGANCSEVSVQSFFSGERNLNTPKGRRVLFVAMFLAKRNEDVKSLLDEIRSSWETSEEMMEWLSLAEKELEAMQAGVAPSETKLIAKPNGRA